MCPPRLLSCCSELEVLLQSSGRSRLRIACFIALSDRRGNSKASGSGALPSGQRQGESCNQTFLSLTENTLPPPVSVQETFISSDGSTEGGTTETERVTPTARSRPRRCAQAGRTPEQDSIMVTHSLVGAATGRQISAAHAQRGIAKRHKKERDLKLRKVAELQADAVPGPGFLDKEPAEDIVISDEEMTDEDIEYVPGTAAGSGLPKRIAEKKRPRQQARARRHRQQSSNDEDSSLEPAEDSVSTEATQDEENLPGRAQGSGQPKTPAKMERRRQQAGSERPRQRPPSDEDSGEQLAGDTVGVEEIRGRQDAEYVPGSAQGSGQPKTPANKERPRQQIESRRQTQETPSSEHPAGNTVSEEDGSSPHDEEYLPGRAQGSGQPKKVAEKERPRQQTGAKRRREDPPSSEKPAENTVSEEYIGSPQDEGYLPGRAQGSGQPKKVAEKERPRKKPRQDRRSTEEDGVSEKDMGDPLDPEYMPGRAEGSWLPLTPSKREAPKKRSRRESSSDAVIGDEDHPQRCTTGARSSPLVRTACTITTGQGSAPVSSTAWQADDQSALGCHPDHMSGMLSAAAPGSAYYASQTYYSGSTCAAASTFDPSFLHPAAMLSQMYHAGRCPSFPSAYQGPLATAAMGSYTPAFGHILGTSTSYGPLSAATSSQLPPVPDTAGGAVFDALLESDSDMSRSSSFSMLSDALGAAAPAACTPETPQSAYRDPCTGGPSSAACRPGVQSFFALHNTAVFQGFGHGQLPVGWPVRA